MKNNKFKQLFALSFVIVMICSCTDLEIEPTDSIITQANANGSTFNGVADIPTALDDIRGQFTGLIGNQSNLYALNEVTTDAALIPTRGTDWGDNGLWRSLHQHEWGTVHRDIDNTWLQVNRMQLNASEILDEKSNANAEQIAIASFYRAWSYFIIAELFGQVPVRDVNLPLGANPEVFTAAEMVPRIVEDLDVAIANLPAVSAGGGDGNRDISKAAARHLKAKVLLQKFVLEGATDASSADMAEVIALVDAIATDGYALAEGDFNIFREAPDTETILWVNAAVGNRIWNGLHYNSAPEITSGWNGFSTLAGYYDLFEGAEDSNRVDADGAPLDGQEERRGGVPSSGKAFTMAAGTADGNEDGFADGSNIGSGFLVGQQYNVDGSMVTDRQNNPLVFSRRFVDGDNNDNLINNDEKTGIRVIKYNPQFGGFTEHSIYFRYADAYLMKAEAMWRSGQDPTAMINELRMIRKASPLGAVTAQDILDERGRELYTEHWRRQDLLRFGQYTKEWEFKPSAQVGNDQRKLFPIPANQLVLNPNLTQNPGY